MFTARRAIEAAVVEQVVDRVTQAEIAALRRLVHDEEAAYRRGDRTAGLKLSLGFHHRMGELCGNPVLVRYLSELVLQTSLAVALYEQPDRIHAHADHLDLLAAIARRDPKRAVRKMLDHLQDLERDLNVDAVTDTPSLATIFGKA